MTDNETMDIDADHDRHDTQTEEHENLPGLVAMTFSKALEWMFNQALKMDEFEGASLQDLDETVVQLTFRDLHQTAFITYYADAHQFCVQSHLMGAPDAHVQTTVADWVSHRTQSDQALGQAFVEAMQSMKLDWEEALSHYVGDQIAFQVGHGARTLKKQGQAAKHKVNSTLREYLQFELNALPTRDQVTRFNQEVSALEDRVIALEKALNETGSSSGTKDEN